MCVCVCVCVCVSIVTCGISIGLWFTVLPTARRVLGTASHFFECKSGILECGECDQNTTFFLLLPCTKAHGGSHCLLCHVQTSRWGSQAYLPRFLYHWHIGLIFPAAWLWVPCLKCFSHHLPGGQWFLCSLPF